jgi:hypothetical protein
VLQAYDHEAVLPERVYVSTAVLDPEAALLRHLLRPEGLLCTGRQSLCSVVCSGRQGLCRSCCLRSVVCAGCLRPESLLPSYDLLRQRQEAWQHAQRSVQPAQQE